MAGLKSMLVHVDETPHCPARLALAATLAQRHGAALTGVYVEPSLMLPAYMPGEISPALIDIIETQRKSAQAKAEAAFAELKRQMPQATWRFVGADPAVLASDDVALLAGQARCADLTIVGQTGTAEEGSSSPGLVPEQLVMQAGRPVLVVPYAGKFASVGERALVAWTDTRESARALADALPLLAQAKSVTVLQICAPGAESVAAAQSGLAAVVEYLQRHQIAAKADVLADADAGEVGAMLLSRAADLDADLLVMGGYGHSRLRELVLGGATREILGSMTLPVLLSH